MFAGFNPGIVDFILATLIGLIDLNPLLDLFFTPLAWVMGWVYGG